MKRQPFIFFISVFVLSIPFYILGATGAKLPGLPFIPINALMVAVPMLVALALTYRQHGSEAAAVFLKSAFANWRNLSAGWISIALLFMPVVSLLEFGILRLVGSAIPIPQIALGQSLLYFVVFFIGAIAEELGWQGYAYPSLRSSHTIFGSALILGTIWALWHVAPFIQMGRSTNWIIRQGLCTIALRFVIVWLFENTGKSILIAVLFHTMFNISWALFPVAGSYYDPFITFIILVVALGLIAANKHFIGHELRTKT